MGETGRCRNCGSEIDADRTRCPDCQYAPADRGLAGRIAILIAWLVFLSSAFVLVVPPVLLADGAIGLQSAAAAIGGFGAATVVSGGYIYVSYRRSELTPVEDELDLL